MSISNKHVDYGVRDQIVEMQTKMHILEKEVADIRRVKHDDNNRIQSVQSLLEIFQENQEKIISSLRDEIKEVSSTLSGDLRRISDSLSKDIAKIINWRFMLIGGSIVGTSMIGGAIMILKMYLDYIK